MKNTIEVVRCLFNPQDTFSTKEFAEILKKSTSDTYKKCLQLEKLGIICKYGYKTKYGWEDVEQSKLRPNSIYWQVCL